MNDAYRRLTGNLPWRDAPPGAPFVHDARTLRAWIEQLPMANFQVATRRLLEGLQALNRSRSDGTRRLEALEMLRGAVAQLAAVTEKQIIGSSFPLPAQKAELGQLALGFQSELALGYRMSLAELCGPAGAVPFLRGKQVALAAVRALQHGSEHLDKASLLYRAPPPGAWQAMHDTYRFIASLRLADRDVDDPLRGQPLKATTAYLQALLVALANPYRHTQREQLDLVGLARVLAPLAELRERNGTRDDLIIHTDADRGPGYIPEESKNGRPDALSLRLERLLGAFGEQMTAVRDDARNVIIRARGGQAQALDLALARRFQADWSAHGERGHTRLGGGHVLDTVIGLQDLHAALAGGEDFETFMRHVRGQVINLSEVDCGASWRHGSGDHPRTLKYPARVIDQGLGGYRVLWERGNAGEVVRARVAEVVGLALAGDGARPEWMIGVIRWIRIDEEGRVDAGIELLARHALPVGVRALDDDRRAPVRGLLLASMNLDPGIDYDALLASTEIDRSVREVELTAPADLYGPPKPARSERLENLRALDMTGIYQHFALTQH